MTLTFTQENGLYVAEFEATAPFSIHLERPKGGFINMLQRSVDSGTFVAVKNFNPNYNATQVIDADCGQGAVYPKWIRIESAVEPSVAEVTFESESSGGGAGTESTIEYYSIDWDKAREAGWVTDNNELNTQIYALFNGCDVVKVKKENVIIFTVMSSVYSSGVMQNTLTSMLLGVEYFSFKPFKQVIYMDGKVARTDEYNTLKDLYPNLDTDGIVTSITKEQFYNLEA